MTPVTRATTPLTPGTAPVARRVLVVSADIGGGHHATGRALQERVLALWPGSRLRWVDTLDAMSPGLGRLARRTYVTNVEVTPWLYEFFYSALWRHRWFATASKRFIGSWAGRRLAPVVEAFDPDLIISTYPLGSAGLDWLRERRGLGVPVGAWVSDFAPHPFWVYRRLDLNLVVHPAALPVAAVGTPDASVAACAPPVVSRFHPGDRIEARRSFGLAPSRPVVVVACGTFGFGAVEEAVRALAGLGTAQVVAVCGNNDRLAERLARLDQPAERLTVLGWVDDMPTLLRAADLLVTNAGGATALEAWATGTPVVMYRPIAAHGVANAALMTTAGLAETCRNLGALVACVRSRLAAGHVPDEAQPSYAFLPDLGLPDLGTPRPSAPLRRRGGLEPSWPLRAQDAFFLYAQSPTVAQQIGAVLDIDPLPDGRALSRADVVDLLTQRLPAVTTLRRRLVSRGRWRRPGWVIDRYVDPMAHLEERRIEPGTGDASAVIDRFWSEPLPTDRPPWRLLLVTGLPGGRTRLAVKLHHSLGDGLSAIGTLQRLLDPAPGRRVAGGDQTGGNGGAQAEPPPPPAVVRARARLQGAALTLRGLARLAAAGPAPRTALNRPLPTPHRRLVTTTLPTAAVRQAARACGAHPSELMCALTAEALRRTYPGTPVPPQVRAMFAVSGNPRARAQTQGNWTGAVALDLPLGPSSVRARAAAVRDRLRGSLASGQPAAAALVMRAMGLLSAPVHAALARRVYTSRFVNVIVSYVTGAAHPQLLAGAPVRSAVPVVALADRVPIGVGVLRWGEITGIGVLLDAALADAGDAFVAELQAAFDEILRESDRRPGATRCA